MKTGVIAFLASGLLGMSLSVPEALADCSLTIEQSIKSGWNKKGVRYRALGDTVSVAAGERVWEDSDSIYIGAIKGCEALIVNVVEISGNYPWDGKAVGISFANDKREAHQWGNSASFPPPRGYAIDDGFVKAKLSDGAQLIYEIPNSSMESYFGAKMFLGRHNFLELQFEAVETLDDLQFSGERPSRSYEPYATEAGFQSPAPVGSCASSCHEPRMHRSSIYDRDLKTHLSPECRE